MLVLLLFCCTSIGCRQGEERKEQDLSVENDTVQTGKDTLQVFSSTKWGVNIEVPQDFQVYEGEVAGQRPVINVYPGVIEKNPPFLIHEDLSMAYIAILPLGYGVDAPSGKRKSFLEWEGNLPLSFEINSTESTVYLLENDEPWAFSLRFFSPPGSWTEEGLIFIRFKVQDVKMECEDEEGNSKPVENCDPLAGERIKYFGEVDQESRKKILSIVENLYFFEENPFREPIEDIIHLEEPEINQIVSSPINISGRAKGYWFFEGVAPVKLVNEDYRELANGTIKAKGEWMTEDFVPFEGKIEFNTEGEQRGFLIFNRSNPSGKPEHDRSYRIPVRFPRN